MAVYDSMYRSAGMHVKSQVASLLHSDAPKIHLHLMDSQIQAGGSDCGLFAIANATTVVVKKDPGKFFYDQKKMRRHLFECLEKRKITLFPVKRERLKYRQLSFSKFIVFADYQKECFHVRNGGSAPSV